MKILTLSDLHLEFDQSSTYRPQADADVLVLAGDILLAADLHAYPYGHEVSLNRGTVELRAKAYCDFFDYVSEKYEHVLYVAGNHEFYEGKWHRELDTLKKFVANFKNVHFMENSSIEIGGVQFFGSTMWTGIYNPMDAMAVDVMNDYRVIVNEKRNYGKLKVADTNERHYKFKEALKNFLMMSDKEAVVITHHLPTFAVVDQRYVNDPLTPAYATELSDIIVDNPRVKLWVHGHSHGPCDMIIGDTRVFRNPRGYPGQRKDFEETVVVF